MAALTVGLTGGIASGKSLVGDLFAGYGVPIIDADLIAREVVQPPSPALERIRQSFGAHFLRSDGSLDRAQMRRHVFSDPVERKRLESILHPLIEQRIAELRGAWTQPYGLLSAAILLESGLRKQVQRVLVVDSPVALQLQRLMQRDGIDRKLAESMMAAQLPREQRLQQATEVIDNSGDIAQARSQVEHLHNAYLALARGGSTSTRHS
jgi:dephospho-CoA kinase